MKEFYSIDGGSHVKACSIEDAGLIGDAPLPWGGVVILELDDVVVIGGELRSDANVSMEG
jgi:hypothetical protein